MNTATYEARTGRDAVAPTTTNTSASRWHRVSWGAIIAGVIVAMALQLVLSLLGAGLGLSTIDPLKQSSPDAATFGIAAGVWWIVSNALSLFGGGWVAAHLAGAPDKTDASLHGLLTWGLATVVTAYLVTSLIGAVIGGGGKMVNAAASASASPAAEAARRQAPADLSIDNLKNQAQQRLAQAANPSAPAPVDPSAPLTEEQKQQAEAKARQVADESAKRGSQAALALLLALVVGAVSATFGGSLAGRRYWATTTKARI